MELGDAGGVIMVCTGGTALACLVPGPLNRKLGALVDDEHFSPVLMGW